jgi:hypothetical protein
VRDNNAFFLTSVLISGNTNPPLKRHSTWEWKKSECWPRERLHAVFHAKWVVTPEKRNPSTVLCSGHKCPKTEQHTFTGKIQILWAHRRRICGWHTINNYRFLDGYATDFCIICEVYRRIPMLDNFETPYSNDFCLLLQNVLRFPTYFNFKIAQPRQH